jgi:hypothetical protein
MHAVADAGAIAIRCPGCGGRISVEVPYGSPEQCSGCDTVLKVSARRLDIECTVRERLYGHPRASVDVAPRTRALVRDR